MTELRCSRGQGSLGGRWGMWGLSTDLPNHPKLLFAVTCWQVDSAQDRVVKREDGEKLAKVREVSVCCSGIGCCVL